MKCNRTNCPNEATHVVQLELHATQDGPKAVSSPIVFVCDEHTVDITIDDLLDAKGWVEIARAFTAQGYVAPRKKYSKVIVQSMPDYLKGTN